MKRQLETASETRVVELENQVKFLDSQIKDLQNENASLLRIQKEQEKALEVTENTQEFNARIKQLNEELRNTKEEYKQLLSEYKGEERVMKEQHQKYCDLEDKCRKLTSLIKQKKDNPQQQEVPGYSKLTEQDIEQLRKEVEDLQKQKETLEKKGRQKVIELENQIREAKH